MAPPPKCYVSSTTFSSSSSSPSERIILAQPFNHSVDILLPAECYGLVAERLHAALRPKPRSYRRLTMPLGEILSPGFFNLFIKSGDILLLSDGRAGVDNVFSLADGVLRMSLSKEAYEKAGLVGKPSKIGAGSGIKRQRWLVELNLRSPAYLTGSKSFNRLLAACNRVFAKPRFFLFADLADSGTAATTDVPVFANSTARHIEPEVSTLEELAVPAFVTPAKWRLHGGGKGTEASYNREVWREWACEVYEWLALALLPADRLLAGGKGEVDPLLSTYSVENAHIERMVRMSWTGLLPAKWVWETWSMFKELTGERSDWATMTVQGFEALGGGENAVTVLRLPVEARTDGKDAMVFELVPGHDERS